MGGAYWSLLYGATIAVNLLAMVLAFWLGLFILSRSPRSLITWLTTLTLWSMGAMFLSILLTINPPPIVTIKNTWIQQFFPLWTGETFAGSSWLERWSIAPGLALWHHVTILLLPGNTSTWQKVKILGVYLLAAIAVIMQAHAQVIFTSGDSSPLYLDSLRAGPWYPIFALAMLIIVVSCVLNLVYAARHAPSGNAHKQLQVLAWATFTAGLASFVSIAASFFMLPVPVLVISILEAIPVFLIGWSVARFGAFLEMRISQKDFLYNLFLLGLVLLIYIPISLFLIKIYRAPMAVLAVFPALAVITHSSMAAIYRFMDRFFYHQEIRQLRSRLRQLWRTVGVNGTLEVLLEPSLETICSTVEAAYGLVLIFENDSCRKVVSYHLGGEIPPLDIQKITADDAVNCKPGLLPPPMSDASLLVPLYGDTDQLGALILGRPENGLYYAPEDVDQILEFTDQIGDTIQTAQRNAQYLAEITRLVQAQDERASKSSSSVSAEHLELALRNMHDLTYLADSPLANMKLVRSRLAPGEITHLERGKMLHAVLQEGLEKLRPGPGMPPRQPSREWYPYLILREAYVNETSNRDIMLKLYISEGTFNRTRRTAIRSLTRALGEMEASIS